MVIYITKILINEDDCAYLLSKQINQLVNNSTFSSLRTLYVPGRKYSSVYPYIKQYIVTIKKWLLQEGSSIYLSVDKKSGHFFSNDQWEARTRRIGPIGGLKSRKITLNTHWKFYGVQHIKYTTIIHLSNPYLWAKQISLNQNRFYRLAAFCTKLTFVREFKKKCTYYIVRQAKLIAGCIFTTKKC